MAFIWNLLEHQWFERNIIWNTFRHNMEHVKQEDKIMTKDLKEYMKAYYKAYYQAHKEEKKNYRKAYYQAHKEEEKEHNKSYYQAHKEEVNNYQKDYNKDDVNSSGQPKHLIRLQSRRYLSKQGTKIPGYEIHHCFTYDDPKKFIYCSKEMHQLIHSYLREHNIDADSNHYEQIKHLIDDTVYLYGIEEQDTKGHKL